MGVSVCPFTMVDAPVSEVFAVLTTPREYDMWWNAKLISAHHLDGVQAGDAVRCESKEFGRTWRVTIHIDDVDHANHMVKMRGALPLGMMSAHTISCTEIGEARARLQFGCSFEFPKTLGGLIMRMLFGRKVTGNVADSMNRVKARAESRYRARLTATKLAIVPNRP